MSRDEAPAFPLRDVWMIVVPVLPLIVFTVLTASLFDPAERLGFLDIARDRFVAQPQREYVHLGDMLTYYAVAAFHTLLCLSVIAVLVRWLRGLPARAARSGAVFLIVILLVLVGIGVFFGRNADTLVLVQVGFKAPCRLLEVADLPTQLTVPGCFGGGLSRLTWLAWFPTFSGMVATAFAAAFAYAVARAPVAPEGSADRDGSLAVWREQIEQRVRALQHGVYLLSAVLVSSTVTITQFAYLPVGLLTKDGDLAMAVSKYATGLSTLWGALFSVTLIATFAAPALRVFEEAYGRRGAATESDDLEQWLHEHVFQSVKRQLGTVLSLLAPLLVGPLSNLISSFSRF